jgi:hypothetical protein
MNLPFIRFCAKKNYLGTCLCSFVEVNGAIVVVWISQRSFLQSYSLYVSFISYFCANLLNFLSSYFQYCNVELVDIIISSFKCILWCFTHYATFPYKFHAVSQNTCRNIFKCPMLFHMYTDMFYTRAWSFVVQLYLWILQSNDNNSWSRALLEKLTVAHVIFNFE